MKNPSQRILSRGDFDVDCFWVTDSEAVLFVVSRTSSNFEAEILSLFQKRFPGAKVLAIGGALKFKNQSVPMPAHYFGEKLPKRISVEEVPGRKLLIEIEGVLNSGIFLDQRENRLRVFDFLKRSESPRMLNLFSYTCAFSVVAAQAGAVTTSIDVSKRYLEWGKACFLENGIDPKTHAFHAQDARDFLKRAENRKNAKDLFDLIVLDPPTFSRSDGKVFRVEKDLPAMLQSCAALLAQGGLLFVSCNDSSLEEEDLEMMVFDVFGDEVKMEPVFPSPEFPRTHALKGRWVTFGDYFS